MSDLVPAAPDDPFSTPADRRPAARPRGLLVVVTEPGDLDGVALDGITVVEAERYLAGEGALSAAGLAVVNLCRSRRYLSPGWYVSLLADARGQRALPTVDTIEAMSQPMVRARALREAGVEVLGRPEVEARRQALDVPAASPPPIREWDDENRPWLRPARPEEAAEVTVCLGRAPEPRFQRLASRVYRAWPAPVLRLRLLREGGRWKLYDLAQQPTHALTPEERAFLAQALRRPRVVEDDRAARRVPSLAVLFDPDDPYKPSSPETIERIERAGARRGLRVQRIGPGDLSRLGEHDALLIRTLTGPDLPAARFAARAEALLMPVIDDPASIIRCANKVFLHELMARAGLPVPRTLTAGRSASFAQLGDELGLPYVLKLPDGSFSAGVHKVRDAEEHARVVGALLARSPLVVAQAYLPTAYDWRVTVLGGRPLFACRYHMAPGHWQIRDETPTGARYGRVDAIPLAEAPPAVLTLACRAAGLVGDGLYGVDLKEGPEGPVVIEVNDNPNIDTGYDDRAEGDAIYAALVDWFLERVTAGAAPRAAPAAR